MRVHTFWFNTELHVWRETTVDDGAGGQTVTYVDQGAEAFKVDQSTATERLAAAQAGAAHSHNVYADLDVDVRRNDRLAASGVNPNSERPYYEVEATFVPSEAIYIKAQAERVEAGP